MVSIIVAISKNGVIGKNGEIPWHLPDDLKRFARITKGHSVIMGRKTYESIIKRLGKPLPERDNIVITGQRDLKAPGCKLVQSIDEAIKLFSPIQDEVFVIGGGDTYNQFLPIANKLYITKVNIHCDGDVMFPQYNEREWRIYSKEHHGKDEKHVYSFDYIEFIRK